MIGLAISMGASGLLLPQRGDKAIAVEPLTEPASAAHPIEPQPSFSPQTEVSEEVAASPVPKPVQPEVEVKDNSEPPSSPVLEHQVEEGQTLWELSQKYRVQPEAIAASNAIKPEAVLPVGQRLRIPATNGIVHQVQEGETVETVSTSYGVEPTQLQASAPVSESGQLPANESVTVPGNVNDLLKTRQDVALKRLREQRDRLSGSLAELRSEESTQSLKLASRSQSASASAEAAAGTLPPAELEPERAIAGGEESTVSVPTGPVTIPVPTPEVAITPTGRLETAEQEFPSVDIPAPTPEVSVSPSPASEFDEVERETPAVTIPVPTPEVAVSPFATDQPEAGKAEAPAITIPVPTPEVAASAESFNPEATERESSSVVIPVPTPDTAASLAVKPNVEASPRFTLDSATPFRNVAEPHAPEPVRIEPLGSAKPENIYQVKPGDTVDAIARRHGLSRAEIIQANGLNNPNLIRVDQQLRIPQSQPVANAESTIARVPGIRAESNRSQLAQNSTVPTLPNPVPPVAQTELERPQIVRPPVVEPTASRRENQQEATSLVSAKPERSAQSESNPYVERLIADIMRMREEQRELADRDRDTEPESLAVPTVETPRAPQSPSSATAQRVNPEFNPEQYAQRQQQQQQAEAAPIPIEVPPPEQGSSTSQQIAVAPAPAEGYNPMLQPPVGETVSPDLPPLSAPDMYLPDSPARFNGYIWPAKGVLTSGYGMRWGRMHKGIDIAAPVGTPIVAAAPGVVVTAGWNSGGYGNLVELQHPDGSTTLYAHNSRILVRRGQEVAQGQQISEMGSTGYSTGPHLHFEVHPSGRGAVNPMAFLPKKR
jgi:murein DD-endopeptidase MepM/ murein hydrolase activator NlpD